MKRTTATLARVTRRREIASEEAAMRFSSLVHRIESPTISAYAPGGEEGVARRENKVRTLEGGRDSLGPRGYGSPDEQVWESNCVSRHGTNNFSQDVVRRIVRPGLAEEARKRQQNFQVALCSRFAHRLFERLHLPAGVGDRPGFLGETRGGEQQANEGGGFAVGKILDENKLKTIPHLIGQLGNTMTVLYYDKKH